jgi:hypothetical protein
MEAAMPYRIAGLAPEPFLPLFELSDEDLAGRGARRVIATSHSGFPCRISLKDAKAGEELLLINYEHQPAATPFKSCHAIYVRRNAVRAFEGRNELPPVFHGRTLSLRGFDAEGMLVAADLAEGSAVVPAIECLFADDAVTCIHAHSAKPGCFLARVDRLPAPE